MCVCVCVCVCVCLFICVTAVEHFVKCIIWTLISPHVMDFEAIKNQTSKVSRSPMSIAYSYLTVCGIVVLICVCSIARPGC